MTPPTTAPTGPAALSPSLEPRSTPPGTPCACATTGSATAATTAAIPIKRRIMITPLVLAGGAMTSDWSRFGSIRPSAGAADGIDDPSPQRANAAVARLLGARHQIDRLGVAGRNIKRCHQLLAKSRSRLDQRRHREGDAKALLGSLQHR